MGRNPKSSVPGSSGTKRDDGSGKDKRKPTSSNPSGSCQNDSWECFGHRDVVADKTTDVPPVTQGGSSNDRGSSTTRSSSDGNQNPSEFQCNSRDKPKKDDISSTGTGKSHFGGKDNNSSAEQKSSDAKDAASQKSQGQKKTNDTWGHFGHNVSSSPEGTSGSVPETHQNGVSSTTGEHSSEKDTGTAQLQSRTVSEGNKSSIPDLFGRRKAQKK